MTATRASLLLVLVCFCLPLFVGLGKGDLQNDEAIYSYSVDRMLESGDWLAPKASPYEDAPFLEKPPLKFWIVGLPIRLGLLPHDEFGLRFWDAVFGSMALLYVCAIGCGLAGPVCGSVAAMTLFAFRPLLVEHGLRSNHMEAPLFLCYCGGVFHYLRAMVSSTRAARWHAAAAALFFVLGFMTKFVAALFLPLVLVVATASIARYRRKALADWLAWAGASALALALIVPWFAYAYHRFGMRLWDVMLKTHVYTRMTSFLDPQHVQPWWGYYWTNIYRSFWFAGSVWLVLGGAGVLATQTVRKKWPEGFVLLLWFALPMVIISAGTSKLLHYAYPFLPPLALGAGYLAALIWMLAPAPIARIHWPKVSMVAVAVAAGAVAAGTLATHELRMQVGGLLIRNESVFRPALLAALAAVLASGYAKGPRVAAALLVVLLLPVTAYAQTLRRLGEEPAPIRELRDCLIAAESRGGSAPAGLYVDVPDSDMGHPVYYYLRQVRPWTRAQSSGEARIGPYLVDDAASRPILITLTRYRDFLLSLPPGAGFGPGRPAPAAMAVGSDLILLPGRYAACKPAVPALLR